MKTATATTATLRRFAPVGFAVFAALLSAARAGTVDTFSGGPSLLGPAGYSTGTPTNISDVNLTTSTAGLTISGGTVTAESLYQGSSSSVAYTITNGSATASTLTLGNGAGFTNANNGVANDLIALAGSGSLTITSTASKTLGVVLASSGAFDVGGSETLSISANISEAGGSRTLTIAGTSTKVVTLSGTNSFTGGIVITNVETDITTDANLGAAGGSVTINGGRLGIAASTTIGTARNFLLGANSTGGNKTGTLSIGTGFGAVYNGAFQNLNATTVGDLVKQGGGTLQLGGASTYTGNTFINNATVQLTTGNDRLPTGTTVYVGQAGSNNSGTLDLGGFNQTIAGLNSNQSATAPNTKNTVTTSTGASTLTLGGGSSYAYGDGSTTNSGVLTGALAVSKTGAGAQAFGDVNTYTGGTTVTGGTLLINGGAFNSTTPASSTSGAGTGAVTVGTTTANSGTGTLGGTGTITGAVTVNAGGTITGATAGTSTTVTAANVGTLNLTSALIVNGNYVADVLSGTGSDKLAVGGAFNGTGGTLTLQGTVDGMTTYVLATYNSLAGQFTNVVNPFAGTYNLRYTGDAATAGELDLVPVPEPGTWLGGLLLGGSAVAAARRRMRR